MIPLWLCGTCGSMHMITLLALFVWSLHHVVWRPSPFSDYKEALVASHIDSKRPGNTSGTFVIPDSSTRATTEFIEACAYLDGVQREMETPDIVDRFQTVRNSWSIRKEKTSTYNHHLGNYKAIMKDDYHGALLKAE